ncbi:MAG: hypothetical protein JXQ90_06695 [Cyclobacteriaceae bacterium]
MKRSKRIEWIVARPWQWSRSFFLIIILIAASFNLAAQDDERNWTLRGYVKDMVTMTRLTVDYPFYELDTFYVDNLIHNRLNFQWISNDKWSAKIELRNRLLVGDTPKGSPDLDTNNDFFNLSYNWQNDNLVFNSVIDRAYVQYSADDWILSVGRQRINWGVNVAWNPNDIFNAYSLVDFDYAERPGSDAIRFQKFIGYAGGYELAVKLADDWTEVTAAGLYKWNVQSYDVQIMGGIMQNNIATGAGWAGNIGLMGFKGEFSYFYPLNDVESDGFLGSMTWDYSFPNSLYFNGSFLYSTYGTDSFGGTSFFQTTSPGDVRYLSNTEWTTFLQSSYTFHPLVNGGLMLIYFPGSDDIFYLAPTLTLSPWKNFDIDAIGQIIVGMDDVSMFATNIRAMYSF